MGFGAFDRDDAKQLGLIAAWTHEQNGHLFKNEEHRASFCATVARNKLTDHFRKESNRRRLLTEGNLFRESGRAQQIEDACFLVYSSIETLKSNRQKHLTAMKFTARSIAMIMTPELIEYRLAGLKDHEVAKIVFKARNPSVSQTKMVNRAMRFALLIFADVCQCLESLLATSD